MALRFSEEPTSRLSPQEAREFLRVHAEREARSTAADAPTVDDIAETLGITPEEARSILHEARARTAPLKAKPRTTSQQEARIATIILACALVAAGSFLVVAPRSRSIAAPATLPAENLSPVPTSPAPSSLAVEPPVQAPPLVYSPSSLSYALPPPGFRVRIDSPTVRIDTGTSTQDKETDYRLLEPGEAEGVQRRLATTCLDLIRSAPSGTWRGADEASLSIMLRGGRWTRLVLPLGPGLDPETMRVSLTKVVTAAWPQIVR